MSKASISIQFIKTLLGDEKLTTARKNSNCFGMAIAAFLRAHQWPLGKLLTTKLRQL